jgi:hypothetical protein
LADAGKGKRSTPKGMPLAELHEWTRISRINFYRLLALHFKIKLKIKRFVTLVLYSSKVPSEVIIPGLNREIRPFEKYFAFLEGF